eukprot:10537242-Heterocapsa_arctica.AAC.1
MTTMVNTIRGMFAKWIKDEYTHGPGNEVEAMGAQSSLEEDDEGDADQQAENRKMTPEQQIIEKDIQNIEPGRRASAGPRSDS